MHSDDPLERASPEPGDGPPPTGTADAAAPRVHASGQEARDDTDASAADGRTAVRPGLEARAERSLGSADADADPAPDGSSPAGSTPTGVARDIPAPGPPAFADGAERRLEPGWIAASRYGAWIFWGIAGIAGLAVLTIVAMAGKVDLLGYVLLVAALFVAVAIVLSLAWMWPTWEHARAGYRILPDRIESWRGLLWRSRVSVPVSRVQYTDVQQGPIQRRHGIATLVVHTAGSSNAEVSFPGLPPALANEVRDWLVGVTGSDAV